MIEVISNRGFQISAVKATLKGKARRVPEELEEDFYADAKHVSKDLAGVVPGDIEDILYIDLKADIGDITNMPDSPSRWALYEDQYVYKGADKEPAAKTANALVIEQSTMLARLREAAAAQEHIRIWYGDYASDLCNYYWLMHELRDAKGKISAVKVPRLCKDVDGYYIERRPSGSYSGFALNGLLRLGYEQVIHPKERVLVAKMWEKLVRQNAPLRAAINGVPCSVPENFYDFLLDETLPEGEFKVMPEVGKAVMLHGPGGIEDWWLVKRLYAMVDEGRFEIVSEGKTLMLSILKKC